MSDHIVTEQQKEKQPASQQFNQNRKTASRQEMHEEYNMGTLQRTIMNPMIAVPSNILGLQRVLGNQAVSRIIQAKLSVAPAVDQYEREADRVAGQVMNRSRFNQQDRTPAIERMGRRSIQPVVSHRDIDETQPAIENLLNVRKGGGQTLSYKTKEFMESQFATDLSRIHIHTDHEAGQISQELNAEAFTHGRDIYMAQGRYKPHSQAGQRLLAHEITHVIQQTGTAGAQAESQMVQRWSWKKHPKKKQEQPKTSPLSASPLLDVPSVSEDPQKYTGYLKSHAGKLSDKEKQLLGIKEQQFDFCEGQIDDLSKRRKSEQANELEALGTGKGQEEEPHAHDEAGDLVSMTEDPRFKSRYSIDRKSDQGNWFARQFKKGKETAGKKFKQLKSSLPKQHSVVAGEDYEQQSETKSQKAKGVLKKGGKMLAKKVPLLGSGMKLKASRKEGERQKVAEEVGKGISFHKTQDAMETPLLQNMTKGLAKGHHTKKIAKGISGGVGLIGDLASIGTMGVSQLGSKGAETVISKTVKPLINYSVKGVKAGVQIGQLAKDARMDDRKYRQRITESQSDQDKSENLSNLSSEDPDFSQALLKHLSSGQMSLKEELYTNTMIQKPTGDHTLKPSEVAKLGRQEKARLRERERMGASPNWSLEGEKKKETLDKRIAKEQKKIPNSSKSPKEYSNWLKEHPENLSEKERRLLGINGIPDTPTLPPPQLPSKTSGGEKRKNLLGELLRSEEEKWYD